MTQHQINSLLRELPEPFLLLGDVNAKSPLWGSDVADVRGQIFENLIINNSVSVLNNGNSTHYHIQTNTYSTIDLSLCSSSIVDNFEYDIMDSLWSSDHYPIQIKWKQPPIMVSTQPRYKVKCAKWKEFQSQTEVNFEQNDLSIEDLCNSIQTTIINAAEATIPKTSGNYPKPPVPWWNETCRAAQVEKNRAERANRRAHTVETKIRYNRAKARCRYIMKKARTESFQEYVKSINQNTNLHQIWKKVRKIEGKFSPSPVPVLVDRGGEQHSDPTQTSNILAEHFAQVSDKSNYPQTFQRYKDSQERNRINFSTSQNLRYNEPITKSELLYAIKSATESSAGEDQITYSMIKHSHPTLIQYILQLFNKIYSEGIFPESWTSSIVIPILKPGKDPKYPISYRPISLTSTLCKTMEKVINVRLVWILESEGHISPSQSGFRKNRSTVDHLVQFETHVRQALANKQHTIAIFFDLEKAYDKSWRYGILKSLYDFGLRGNLPHFLSSFLSNRTIKVKIGSTLSNPKQVDEGIPQGSVLSCSCFLIAINNISSGIPPTVKSLLFVDDFTLFYSGHNINSVQRQLQMALKSLEAWCVKTGYKFSTEKTVSMHICRKHNCPKMATSLTLYRAPITCVTSTKFLGVTIDSSLTWRPHLTNLKTRSNKTLDLLKKLSHTDWGSDSTTLLRLYIMLLKPLIEYGMEAYLSAAESYLKPIRAIQNSAIRIATGAFKSTPISSLHAYTSISPPLFASHQKQLNFYFRLLVNPSHPMHDQVIDQEDLNLGAIEESTPPKSFLFRAHSLHLSYNIDSSLMLSEPFPVLPPWKIDGTVLCTEMFDLKKKQIPSHIIQRMFMDHAMNHIDSFQVYTDGSKTSEGVGYAFHCAEHEFKNRISPISSIFSAELLAIKDAINYAETATSNNLTIFSDSRSALQAITNFNANPIAQHIRDLIISSDKTFHLCWVPSHVGSSWK